MNEQDKKEFIKWYYDVPYKTDYHAYPDQLMEAWEAALNYSYNQIETGMKGACPTCEPVAICNKSMSKELDDIRILHKKLHETLSLIAYHEPENFVCESYAELKEIAKEGVLYERQV